MIQQKQRAINKSLRKMQMKFTINTRHFSVIVIIQLEEWKLELD